jgi:hypothetical protein
MLPFEQPDIIDYSSRMLESFRRWTGNVILGEPQARPGIHLTYDASGDMDSRIVLRTPENDAALAHALYHAPFVLVSHGTEPDPIFRYANLAAQELWNITWDKFVTLPSRMSAEPDAQDERDRLLKRAEEHGYVDDYQGIRITSDGRRFKIRQCILWNVLDKNGRDKIGQAATFDTWEWI